MKPSPNVYQVSDLTNEMRRLMETSYPEIWIEGELSSLSTPASGHLYFSLKDEQSQLRCAMFKGRASISRYKAKVGDLVRVRAKISLYTARGDLQCIVQHIEEAGEGVLQRRFEELKHSLREQGLFDQSHKQVLPKFTRHIGIVTSPSGAAVKDVVSTLKRRCPGIPLTIYPAVVQGDSAPSSLIEALNNAVQHQTCDVIILCRGGGSLEDLWCFNDEGLARAIFQCPIPVVSGVGHEVDFTIADLVADVRAPTPTAAAELVSPDTDHLLAQLRSLHFRLPRVMERALQRFSQNVDMTGRQLVHPRRQLLQKKNALRQYSDRLMHSMHDQAVRKKALLEHQGKRFKPPQRQLTNLMHNQKLLTQRLKRAQLHNLELGAQRFTALADQLNLVSPLATIARGFAIARDQNDTILRKRAQISEQQNINVQISDGQIHCKVIKVEK
jgi:exodeoxyribonuclease VII large subunit